MIRICEEYNITNYLINKDGTVDVFGDVNLGSCNLNKIPLLFNHIYGEFIVSDNFLTSLFGCPNEVGGDFSCNKNQLTSLEYTPLIVGGGYRCEYNLLVSLSGSPDHVKKEFFCFSNRLTDLLGGPTIVDGDFYCHSNHLSSLRGAPVTINGDMHIGNNPLNNLVGCPKLVNKDLYISDNILSLYSGYTDFIVKEDVYLMNDYPVNRNARLPQQVIDHHSKIRIILKYQQYFEIWNENQSLNQENFDIFIDEINDGLL